MSDTISVTGIVAGDPKHLVSAGGRPITSFRLASAQRRYDRASSSWVDAATNWYSVTAFNGLAINAAMSLHRGDRVVLRGRLRIRDWEKDGRSGTSADIVAESIGHDLLWGTTAYTKTVSGREDPPAPAPDEEAWAASTPAGRAEAREPELAEPPF